MDVVPRHAGFQRFMCPERRSGDAVNWVDLTGNLIAFASAGLIHRGQNTMDLISVSNIEYQMAPIRSRIIVVCDRVRCVGNDIGTKRVSWRVGISIFDAVSDPLVGRPVPR